MDDLAAELGISKKTLYAHFPGKHALLEEVLQDKFNDVQAALAAARRGSPGDFPSTLRSFLRALQGQLDEIQPPFLRDMRRAPDTFRKLEQRRAGLIRDHFGKLFRAGQRSGDVRADVPVRLMVETLLAAVQAIMNPQKIQELGSAPRETFARLLDLLLHGAMVRKGNRR